MQAWYPLSASVIAAWFMLPLSGTRAEALAWVSLTGPLYAGLFAAAVATLAGRLGCRAGAWALAVVVFLTSRRIDVMASSFSDADLAQATLLFAAMVWTVPPRNERRDAASQSAVDAWYAALLSGIALGVKVSAALPALIVLGMAALRARADARGARAVVRTGGIFAVGWVAMGGYWYLRNLAHTGNPLYPAAFLVWPGSTFPETTLVEYARRYGLARTVADALAVYTDWPWLHAALALGGLAGLAGWLAWRRRRVSRSALYFGGGALATAAAVLVALPATPYSAGNAMTFRSGFVHWDSMRYVGLVALLGWAAIAYVLDAALGRRVGATVAAVTASACVLTLPDARAQWPAALLVLTLAALIARAPLPTWSRGPGGVLVAGAAVLVVGALVIGHHHAKLSATGAAIHAERFFGEAARVLDAQPRGTRVAVFGDQWVHPTLGARDHLEPVRLDGDGRVATAPIGAAMAPGDLAVDAATFVRNLEASRVQVVVAVHLPHPGRSAQRPTQEAALASSPAARLLFRGEAVTVWGLGREPGSGYDVDRRRRSRSTTEDGS